MMQKYLGATYWCELKITAVAAPRVEGLEALKREIPGVRFAYSVQRDCATDAWYPTDCSVVWNKIEEEETSV